MTQARRLLTVALVLAFALQITALPASAQSGSGWWTFIQIQNVDTGDIALTLNAYAEQDGNPADDRQGGPFTVKPGAAVAFNPGLAPTYPTGDLIGFAPDLPANFGGGAVISSDGAAAAIAQVGNNRSGSNGIDNGSATAFYPGIGNAFADTTVNFPTVKNNFNGQTTSFFVQSAGSEAAVTITYKMNDGSTHTQSKTISANRSFTFDPDNATPKVADTNCGSRRYVPVSRRCNCEPRRAVILSGS